MTDLQEIKQLLKENKMSEVHKFYIKGHEFLIDKDKVELISKYNWYLTMHGKNSSRPYLQTNIVINNKNHSMFLHRLLIDAKTGQLVDHKNNNTKDNRMCNLRLCTHAENSRNKSPKKNGTSRYLGVFVDTKNRKEPGYVCRIGRDRKIIYIGTFKTELEAAKAYNEAALKYHGEFANLNKI